MNAMKNRVQLIGNVGNEPEIKNLRRRKKTSKHQHRYKRSLLS